MFTPATRRLIPDSAANASQRVEEPLEAHRGPLAGTYRSELDVARVTARLAPGAAVTHGHPLQRPVGAHQDGVTDSLLEHRDDLAAEVEPAEDPIRQPADLVEDGVAATLRILREERVRALRRQAPVSLAATTVRGPGQKPCFW